MLARQSGAKAKVKDLTDQEQFDMHAYKNKAGLFIQPSEMIEAAMVKAGTNYKSQTTSYRSFYKMQD